MTKKYLMRVVGFADGRPTPLAGQYLRSYFLEVPATAVMGEFTRDPEQAMKFDSVVDLFNAWRTQRMYDGGLRPDGKPDRPLTAYSIETVPHEE